MTRTCSRFTGTCTGPFLTKYRSDCSQGYCTLCYIMLKANFSISSCGLSSSHDGTRQIWFTHCFIEKQNKCRVLHDQLVHDVIRGEAVGRADSSSCYRAAQLRTAFTRAVAVHTLIIVPVAISVFGWGLAANGADMSPRRRHYVNASYAHEQHTRANRKQNHARHNDTNLCSRNKSITSGLVF